MNYIIGMSHILPVLDACSTKGLHEQLHKIAHDQEPEFVNWEVEDSTFPSQIMATSIYIKQIASHWGITPAIMTSPTSVAINPGYQKLLRSINLKDSSLIFAFMYGEEYINLSNSFPKDSLDFILPNHADLPVNIDCQIIPYDVCVNQVEAAICKSIANFAAIKYLCPNLNIINMICPPPTESIDGQFTFHELLKFKYYLLYVERFIIQTTKLGIKSMLPPPKALNNHGMLKTAYSDDGVHGNKSFGNEVVLQMSNLIRNGF